MSHHQPRRKQRLLCAFARYQPHSALRGLQGQAELLCHALHELTHWTKHERRLNRDFGRQKFGDAGYAREELVAELGAAFLCADLGITPEIREDHAAYLAHWLNVLKEDKRTIFSAAAYAQRASDFLAGLQPRSQQEQETESAAADGQPQQTAARP